MWIIIFYYDILKQLYNQTNLPFVIHKLEVDEGQTPHPGQYAQGGLQVY